MERNEKLEIRVERAIQRITSAQRCLYDDPALADKLLNLADEDIHKAIDQLPTVIPGVGSVKFA